MVRFRVGHSFKAEVAPAHGARDLVSLEVDGVSLWPEVSDAPLVETFTLLLDAMAGLYGGERGAQVSLGEGALEVCFYRALRLDVEVSLVSLGAKPRIVRGPVTVSLEELGEAVARAARELARDPDVQKAGGEKGTARLVVGLERLGSMVLVELEPKDAPGFSLTRTAHGGLGFTLYDADGRLALFSKKAGAGLPFLLGPGELTLSSGRAVEGPPFLSLLGLARATVHGDAEVDTEAVPARAVLEAGLDLCVGLRRRNPALAANPWVEALELRCTEGLARERPATPGGSDELEAALRPTAPREGPPLMRVGALRRLSLERRWARQVLVGETGGKLVLGKDFVGVAAPRALHVFSRQGRSRRELRSSRGVALLPSGEVLLAEETRLLFFGAGGGARWLRDHDGVRVGPWILESDGRLVTSLEGRGVMALDRVTGRELWRFAPPRTASVQVSLLGGRVLVGTDGGMVHGIDVKDGATRFRIRGPLPCVSPPVAFHKGAACVLGRGEQVVLFAFDQSSADAGQGPGTIRFSRELALSKPCAAVAARQRLYVGGVRDGRTVVVALAEGGRLLWEKSVPCDGFGLSLLPFEGGVLATDARGAATRLLPDGQPAWVVGSGGEALERAVAPKLWRQVLVVPGPVLRLIDPKGGRTLGELEAGLHLADVALGRNFDVFVYAEPGELAVYRPGALLSVV